MVFSYRLLRSNVRCCGLSSALPSLIRNMGNAKSSPTILFPIARPFSSDRPVDSFLYEVVKTLFEIDFPTTTPSDNTVYKEAMNNPRMKAAILKLNRRRFAGDGIVGVDMGDCDKKVCQSEIDFFRCRRSTLEDISPPLHISEFFNAWCKLYRIRYLSLEEKLFRYNIFKKTCVRAWNGNAGSYLSARADSTTEELNRQSVKYPSKNIEIWIPGLKIEHVVKVFKKVYSNVEGSYLVKPNSTKGLQSCFEPVGALSCALTRSYCSFRDVDADPLQSEGLQSRFERDGAFSCALTRSAMSNHRLVAIMAKLSSPSFTGKGIIGIDLGKSNSAEEASTGIEDEGDVSPPIHISELFDVWCKRHKKSYPSQEKKMHMFNNFKENCVEIWRINRDDKFLVWDINQFCDLSSAEMDALLLEYPADDIERCIPGIKIEHVVKQINKLLWKHEATAIAKWHSELRKQ